MTPRDQPDQSAPSLSSRLRAETATLHRLAESKLTLPRTRDEYVHVLNAFRGFLARFEPAWIGTLAPLRDELGDRRKLHWLDSDLEWLGDRTAAHAVDQVPIPFRTNDTAGALGSMYVFEGATLGGQIIARHVAEHLGITGTDGRRFYLSYGNEVGAKWRAFKHVLDTRVPPADHDRAIDAAKATFQSFADWIDSCRTP